MGGVVVAIDAGTTGVRALAVDGQARVTDVAYRELTQHFPRPGWVEHDPDDIWDSVRATLAELGSRLVEQGEAGHLPLVRATTGLVLDPYFSATKAAWLLRHGDLALAADDPNLSFCTVDSWVLWNLTGGTRGGVYATDPSNASRTLLLDTTTLAWSPELCDLFGVPAHTLPEVRPSAGRFRTPAPAALG